jgi:hypothetical protein
MAGKKEMDVRFKKFGTVSFTSTTKVNDFVDRLASGMVSGTRCRACGRRFFPPRADCCDCLSSDMEWFDVSGMGRLVTFSRLQFAPMGFDADLPYAIALLDYDDFKVFGRISAGVDPDEIEIGMPMKTVANVLPNGQLNYVFQKV